MSTKQPKKTLPPQHQNERPGLEYKMNPRPIFDREVQGKKLTGKRRLSQVETAGLEEQYLSYLRKKEPM